MNVIPAIDLRGGNCVRLFQGDFDRETRYSDDPLAVARRFLDMGFRYLHVVDLDGAKSGEQVNRDIVAAIVADSGLDVQLGGGIRDREAVVGWLDAGVRRVVIGSVAVSAPDRASGWLEDFGADRFVLALDCRPDDDGTPWLATHGWTRQSDVTLWDCVARYEAAGLAQVLCTDVSRDGAMTGPSLDLYREFVVRFPGVALQASGGVRGMEDLEALREIGASAAITGRAMLDGRIDGDEVASFLRSA